MSGDIPLHVKVQRRDDKARILRPSARGQDRTDGDR